MRIRAMFLITLLVFLLVSCGGSENNAKTKESTTQATTIVSPTEVVVEPTPPKPTQPPVGPTETPAPESLVSPIDTAEPTVASASEPNSRDIQNMIVGAWYEVEEDGSPGSTIMAFNQDGRYFKNGDGIGAYRFLDDTTLETTLPGAIQDMSIVSVNDDAMKIEWSGDPATFRRFQEYRGLFDELISSYWEGWITDDFEMLFFDDGTLIIVSPDDGFPEEMTWEVWNNSIVIWDIAASKGTPKVFYFAELFDTFGYIGFGTPYCVVTYDGEFGDWNATYEEGDCLSFNRHEIHDNSQFIGSWALETDPDTVVIEFSNKYALYPRRTLYVVSDEWLQTFWVVYENEITGFQWGDLLNYKFESPDRLVVTLDINGALGEPEVLVRVK